MKNQMFMLQTTQQREQKLRNVIRLRTNNALTEDELQTLVKSVSPMFQYAITVHTQPEDFCNALILERTSIHRDRGKIIFGQADFGSDNAAVSYPGTLYGDQEPVAAIITSKKSQYAQAKKEIHVYIPLHRYCTERKLFMHG